MFLYYMMVSSRSGARSRAHASQLLVMTTSCVTEILQVVSCERERERGGGESEKERERGRERLLKHRRRDLPPPPPLLLLLLQLHVSGFKIIPLHLTDMFVPLFLNHAG